MARRELQMLRNETRLNKLFEELVPVTGKADSMAGELVRAVSWIGYRFFNDGDRIGLGYGKETCNPVARFLRECGDRKIVACINALWGLNDDDGVYEEFLDALIGAVADYVERRPDLRDAETEDMFSHRDRNEDVDDDGEEDDEEF